MPKRLSDEEKIKRLMALPLNKLTAQQRRLTGRLDIRHGRLPEEIEAYFTLPRDENGRRFRTNWGAKDREQPKQQSQKAFPLQDVPKQHRAAAERRFHEIMARKKARGITITHHHVASAWGNAVNYGKHVLTGNTSRKVQVHKFRRMHWFHLRNERRRAREQAEAQEFKEKPLVKRVKWGMA